MACETSRVGGSGADAVGLMHSVGSYDASHGSRAIRRYFGPKPSEVLVIDRFIDCRAARQPQAPTMRPGRAG